MCRSVPAAAAHLSHLWQYATIQNNDAWQQCVRQQRVWQQRMTTICVTIMRNNGDFSFLKMASQFHAVGGIWPINCAGPEIDIEGLSTVMLPTKVEIGCCAILQYCCLEWQMSFHLALPSSWPVFRHPQSLQKLLTNFKKLSFLLLNF